MNAIIINIFLAAIELISFIIVVPRYKKKLFVYYTMLSNMIAAFASVMFLILGRSSIIAISLRYNATCMLVLTCIVANLVLIPMGVGFRGILWVDCGLVFHLIAPVLSLVSYEFFEEHVPMTGIIVPILVTIIYAVVIIRLVYIEAIAAPYPFVEVKKQSIITSIIWFSVIMAAVAAIGCIV